MGLTAFFSINPQYKLLDIHLNFVLELNLMYVSKIKFRAKCMNFLLHCKHLESENWPQNVGTRLGGEHPCLSSYLNPDEN
jgi:hypothetical protein